MKLSQLEVIAAVSPLIFSTAVCSGLAFFQGMRANHLSAENAALRKRLAYWECTDRTPEQPGEPTLVEGEK